MSTHDTAPDDEFTALLADAASMVITTQFGSTSLLQRKLGVGYAKARDIMDALADRGIVGPADGSRARDVHVAPNDVVPIVAQIRAGRMTAADQTPATDSEGDRRLRGIQERAERATIGPWEIRGIEIVRDSEGLPTIQSLWVADIDPVSGDAAFIAAARTDVPWLLAEVDRLTAHLAEQTAAVARVRNMACDGGCNYDDGPEETCSRHGRPVTEVWGIVDTLQSRLAEQAATIERVRAAADTWVKNAKQHWSHDNDDVRANCAEVILDALGSQRTEGQG